MNDHLPVITDHPRVDDQVNLLIVISSKPHLNLLS